MSQRVFAVEKALSSPLSAFQESVGYGISGFLIPIVGLILFIVWHKDYPLRAKSALTGLIVGVILYVLMVIVLAACTAAAI